MITVTVIKWFFGLLAGLAQVLPDYAPPAAADLSSFQIIAWLIPINEVVNLAAMMGAFAAATLIYVTYNWIINKARGSG